MCKLSFLIVLFFVSFTTRQTSTSKTMKFVSPFGDFSMETPNGWTQIDVEAVGSFDGKIAIGQSDTLLFSYGFWSSFLKEGKLLFDWQEPNKYIQAKKYKDKIDGYEVYIVTPKQSGLGSVVFILIVYMEMAMR